MTQLRLFAIAMVFLCLAVPVGAFGQDQLTMKNGDVISGKISVFTESAVTIQPGYASDPVEIDFGAVDKVDIEDGYFKVELADGTQFEGRVAMDSQGQQVLVLEDGTERATRKRKSAGSGKTAWWASGICATNTASQGV